VTIPDFELEKYAFQPSEILTPELYDFFEELEFHSLMSERKIELQNWKNL